MSDIALLVKSTLDFLLFKKKKTLDFLFSFDGAQIAIRKASLHNLVSSSIT